MVSWQLDIAQDMAGNPSVCPVLRGQHGLRDCTHVRLVASGDTWLVLSLRPQAPGTPLSFAGWPSVFCCPVTALPPSC